MTRDEIEVGQDYGMERRPGIVRVRVVSKTAKVAVAAHYVGARMERIAGRTVESGIEVELPGGQRETLLTARDLVPLGVLVSYEERHAARRAVEAELTARIARVRERMAALGMATDVQRIREVGYVDLAAVEALLDRLGA